MAGPLPGWHDRPAPVAPMPTPRHQTGKGRATAGGRADGTTDPLPGWYDRSFKAALGNRRTAAPIGRLVRYQDGTIGPFLLAAKVEFSAPTGRPVRCPNGTIGFPRRRVAPSGPYCG